MSKFFNTKNIAIVGLLIALNIIFVRFLRIGEGSVRISLGFLPICIAGMMLGPVGGGITAVLSDIIGMLLFSRGEVYFPLFTVTELLYGIGFGFMLYSCKLSTLKLSLYTSLQFIVLNLFMGSFWLYLYFILITENPRGFIPILVSRLIASLINLPIQIIGVNIVSKYLSKPLKKIERRC